jgi:transaldolase
MRPQNFTTKLFLDSGDPQETKRALEVLGFLDGQTTNPTLISKNPEVKLQIQQGKKFTEAEIYDFYKKVVSEISQIIPQGSVSIEVFSDKSTSAETMLEQSKKMYAWIPNAHIKFPVTTEGLKAAEQAVKEGMRVNVTLVFTQEQGAAVYAATRGARKGDVFLSPFIGRLDDRGENGMDFIKNTVAMYKKGDGHVETLAASVRTFDHFMASVQYGADIITAPLKVFEEWKGKGMPVPDISYIYPVSNLKPIQYQKIDLNKNWQEYNIAEELTEKGIEKFTADWNALIK